MRVGKFRAAAAAAVLATGLIGLAAPASAQTDVDVAFNVGVVSDYVFRGFSQSNEEAALQAGVDLTAGGFYAGAWASNVDFGDDTDTEVDVYGGYRWEAAGFSWDAGIVGYTYLNEPRFADYTYAEAKLAVSRAVGPATIGGAVYYSPNFFGADSDATYGELNAGFSPIDKLTLSGAVGYQWLDVNESYATWNVGASYAILDDLAIDVRYHGAEIETPLSDDRVVAGIKVLF